VRKRTPVPNLRQKAIQTAKQANVPLDDWDRAQVLGQIAGLLAFHPKIHGLIAFKGGAVMHLIDRSPRFSKDLDASLVAGGHVTEDVLRQALSTNEAKRVVISVGKIVSKGPHSITFPVIVCHPVSGKGQVALQLSVNWLAPLLLKPEPKEITIHGRKVFFLVVARIERIAEKIRAFIVRGRASDAFDLYHFAKQGIISTDRELLYKLVATKLMEDDDVPTGVNLLERFDSLTNILSDSWDKTGLVLSEERPSWTKIEPRVISFRRYVPSQRPARQ
jgi:hypothetical protein